MNIKLCKDVNEYIEILNERMKEMTNMINDLHKQLELEKKKNENTILFIETYVKPYKELYDKYLKESDKLYYEENKFN